VTVATDDTTVGTRDEQTTESTVQRSQIQQFWRQYKKNRLSTFGGAIIGAVLIVALLAPVLAPHDPTVQFDSPPEKYHPMPPGSEIILTNDGEIQQRSTAILGTDHVGRDLLSRIIFGVRTTLIIAISVVLAAMVIGTALGGLAGYFRDSWIDETIMRVMDIIFPFPSLILAIALLGAIGIGETTYQFAVLGSVTIPNILKMILVVTIVYIPRFARVMRGATIREMEEDYVDALKSLGAGDISILVRDVTVNSIQPVVIQGTLYMGTAVLVSAGLSFLGLGVQPPKPGLGVMLSNARGYIYSGEWWFATFPGVMIVIIILGFNLLGDGLRDALDPKYETRGEG